MLKLKMLIQKLEKRFYPRMEIAEIMELSTRDKNFADKVKTRLKNWGYKYIYIKRTVLFQLCHNIYFISECHFKVLLLHFT